MRSWRWDVLVFGIGLGALLAMLSGCVHVAYEPPLPMPARPAWHFFLCDTDKVCLTQADANALNRWLDKLDAFEVGRQRVISGQEPVK